MTNGMITALTAVTSSYVYHNVAGVNKQELTLRVLKKGGTFAIHDIMSKGEAIILGLNGSSLLSGKKCV